MEATGRMTLNVHFQGPVDSEDLIFAVRSRVRFINRLPGVGGGVRIVSEELESQKLVVTLETAEANADEVFRIVAANWDFKTGTGIVATAEGWGSGKGRRVARVLALAGGVALLTAAAFATPAGASGIPFGVLLLAGAGAWFWAATVTDWVLPSKQ